MTVGGRKGLVLGANGFLGWNACMKLLKAGWDVTAFDKSWDLRRVVPAGFEDALKVYEASVFDRQALSTAMAGADVTFYFLSFTVPATTPKFMQVEIQTTLQALENTLSTMVEKGIQRLVFPSSGGAIYGDLGRLVANESAPLKPLSSYGVGKLLGEQMILFYHRIHNLQFNIMRIANAYGADRLNRLSQGLIDVFLEKVLAGEALALWGGINQVRDYIFIDDVMDAMMGLIELNEPRSAIVNVGSGVGSSIENVLSIMREVVGPNLQWKVVGDHYAGIDYNVLDISKIAKITGWAPRHSLEEGIRKTWRRKIDS